MKQSLSATQIQYLKIGPKISQSKESRAALSQLIAEEKKINLNDSSYGQSKLGKFPKLTYGQSEQTVRNFGVLLNKNFGNQTKMHRAQKIGEFTTNIDKNLQHNKTNPSEGDKKSLLMKKIKDRSDNRTQLKTSYNLQGLKLSITLKSFSIETVDGHKAIEGLPIPYLKFLVTHVNSSRLAKIIENGLKVEGNQIVIQFDKIEARASHLYNSQVKYHNYNYGMIIFGQELIVTLPYLEITQLDSQTEHKMHISNKDILEILQSNFDNVYEIIEKYFIKKSKNESRIENKENSLYQRSIYTEQQKA